jgi:hypothetical protein
VDTSGLGLTENLGFGLLNFECFTGLCGLHLGLVERVDNVLQGGFVVLHEFCDLFFGVLMAFVIKNPDGFCGLFDSVVVDHNRAIMSAASGSALPGALVAEAFRLASVVSNHFVFDALHFNFDSSLQTGSALLLETLWNTFSVVHLVLEALTLGIKGLAFTFHHFGALLLNASFDLFVAAVDALFGGGTLANFVGAGAGVVFRGFDDFRGLVSRRDGRVVDRFHGVNNNWFDRLDRLDMVDLRVVNLRVVNLRLGVTAATLAAFVGAAFGLADLDMLEADLTSRTASTIVTGVASTHLGVFEAGVSALCFCVLGSFALFFAQVVAALAAPLAAASVPSHTLLALFVLVVLAMVLLVSVLLASVLLASVLLASVLLASVLLASVLFVLVSLDLQHS